MRRFLAFLLSITLLLTVCATPAVSAAEGIRVPKSWVRGGVYVLRTAGFYSESVRMLLYAFEDVSHVSYGETSVLSRKLAKSDQLNEILAKALESGLTETAGVASFYDGSDLEFSIGACEYTMRFETVEGKNVAIFVLTDVYDFTEVRDGGSISNILNNLGYEWQKNGTIKPYSWLAKVVLPVEEDK